MTLEVLGWNERWQKEFAALDADGLVPGRVIGEHRSHFQVATDASEVSAGITGRLRNIAEERSDLPGVGDFVALRLVDGDGPATIEAVLPRLSALVRKAAGENRPQLLAANIDVVFIMTTPDGDLHLPRLERYLALVRDSGASPVIVVNKADLAHDAVEITGRIGGIAPGVPIYVVSARGRDGIHDLERFFDGNRTIAFVGSSGVGKSTLTNLLLGRAAQATQEVRAHDSRGRHTTTHRQLFTRPKGGSISTRPECARWKSGIPRQKRGAVSKISKRWQPSASSAIVVMRVNRHAPFELLSRGAKSMRDVPPPMLRFHAHRKGALGNPTLWRHRERVRCPHVEIYRSSTRYARLLDLTVHDHATLPAL